MKIVTVVPLQKGVLREDLTYFTTKEVSLNNIVTIPLRNKKVLGLVVAVEDMEDAKMDVKDMNFNLRKILEVKDTSIFTKEYLESAVLMSKYFVSTKSNTVVSLMPAIFREKYDEIANLKNRINNLEINKKSIGSEKLLFQAPLDERIASYKTLIRSSFAERKSVYIVLPTEHDIKIFEETLARGIEQFTYTMHGGQSSKKILKNLANILEDEHPVLILGTAPFLCIPRSDLGTIILEHESGSSYKMIAKPHIDLRIFAEVYASKINAKFILSDTVLRFETIARIETDNLTPLHPLSFRINFEGDLEVLPPSGGKTSKFQIFSDKSIEHIHETLAKKKNVFIFSLRKSLATQTVCNDCKEVVLCETCLAPVVLYISRDRQKRIFSCNRCKIELDPLMKCTYCDSWNLVPLGIGTDTVAEETRKLFPLGRSSTDELKTRIFKLDKESAKTSSGAEKIVKEYEESMGSILIGTEMAFSYLKEKVPLSIIASFDSLWSIPNYKISEKVIQILISIIEKTTHRLIIQTKNENDPAILAVKNFNILSFVREELADRKNLNYPPYKRFIKIIHLGNKEQMLKAKELLGELLKDYNPEIFSGFVAKEKGKYVTNALIKIEPSNWSLAEISTGGSIDSHLSNRLANLPPTFQIFVDPEDLL